MLIAGNNVALTSSRRCRQDRNWHRNGFTLLELTLVLAIVGLLMSLVAPNFSSILPGVEFRRDSARFAATLRQARSSAIDKRTKTQVEIDAKTLTYQILDSNINGKFAEGTELFERGKRIANRGDHVRRVTFYPDGTASETLLSLRLDNRELKVSVAWLTGEVKIDVVS